MKSYKGSIRSRGDLRGRCGNRREDGDQGTTRSDGYLLLENVKIADRIKLQAQRCLICDKKDKYARKCECNRMTVKLGTERNY